MNALNRGGKRSQWSEKRGNQPANCKSIRNERKARSLNSGSGVGGEQRLLTKHGSSDEKGARKRGNRIERKGVDERTVHGKPSLFSMCIHVCVCVCVYLLVGRDVIATVLTRIELPLGRTAISYNERNSTERNLSPGHPFPTPPRFRYPAIMRQERNATPFLCQ